MKRDLTKARPRRRRGGRGRGREIRKHIGKVRQSPSKELSHLLLLSFSPFQSACVYLLSATPTVSSALFLNPASLLSIGHYGIC